MEANMNAVTIRISSVEETNQRMLRAFDGAAQGAFIGFPTVEHLWKVLTAKRWKILHAMTGADPWGRSCLNPRNRPPRRPGCQNRA